MIEEQGINRDNLLIPVMAEGKNHQEDGKFAKGHKVNNSPYQPYKERVATIQNTYSADEIIDIATDRTKLLKRNARDAQIILQLAKTLQWPDGLTNADVRAERETLLDRLEGKPNQKVDVEQKIGIVQLVLEASKLSAGKTMEELEALYRPTIIEHQPNDSGETLPTKTPQTENSPI